MPDEPNSLAKKAAEKLQSVKRALGPEKPSPVDTPEAIKKGVKVYMGAVDALPHGAALRAIQAPAIEGTAADKAKHVLAGSFVRQAGHQGFQHRREELVDRATAALEAGKTDEAYALQLRILQEEIEDADRMGDKDRKLEAMNRALKIAQKMQAPK